VPSVPYYRNPTFKPGLDALVALLMGRNYSGHAIGRVYDHVAVHGTLEGSMVEPEDMADAESAFVDALPAIDFDSPVWGGDFDAALEADDDAMPLPELPDVRDPGDWPSEAQLIAAEAPDGAIVARKMIDAGVLPMPVSGGSPDDEPAPFEPSEDDWRDYREHFDRAEPVYGYE